MRCCGSTRWAEDMLKARPFGGDERLHRLADACWNGLEEGDWLEAFSHHPRIGGADQLRARFSATKDWSNDEQAGVAEASETTLELLAAGNRAYEERFGWIFLVCATGKSAGQMLALLESRMENDPGEELRIAAAEQAKITHIRLEKLTT